MQSGGSYSALSPVVYGDVALSIKTNTKIQIHELVMSNSQISFEIRQ